MIQYPTWLNALLFIGAALDTFFLTQTSVALTPTQVLIAGAINVVFAAALAFQKQVTVQARRLTGRPR